MEENRRRERRSRLTVAAEVSGVAALVVAVVVALFGDKLLGQDADGAKFWAERISPALRWVANLFVSADQTLRAYGASRGFGGLVGAALVFWLVCAIPFVAGLCLSRGNGRPAFYAMFVLMALHLVFLGWKTYGSIILEWTVALALIGASWVRSAVGVRIIVLVPLVAYLRTFWGQFSVLGVIGVYVVGGAILFFSMEWFDDQLARPSTDD